MMLYLTSLINKLKRKKGAKQNIKTCINFDVSLCSTSLGGLAHATVTGLPAETVGPAESTSAAEVLPPHTTPSRGFGKEVSFVSFLPC